MAGLGGYALAGLAQGIGAGMEESGRQQFQLLREELQRDFQRSEREAGQEYRSGEAEKDRTFRAGEREAEQTFRAGESAKDRGLRVGEAEKDRVSRSQERAADRAADRSRRDEAAGRYSDTFTGGDGYLYERPAGGGPARKVVDKETGEPIKAPASKSPDSLTASERAKIILQAQKDNTHTNELNGKTEFDEEGYRRALRAVGIEPVGDAAPKAAGKTANLVSQAQDAIRRGAPRDKVEQRLREHGVDPSLLGQ